MAAVHLPDLVQVYTALGHPARIHMRAMLRTREVCACQITAALAPAPSTVSAHLAELRRARSIAERKEGRWVDDGGRRRAQPSVTLNRRLWGTT
jgi:DNA-binding transcriptional ArsR family regulator